MSALPRGIGRGGRAVALAVALAGAAGASEAQLANDTVPRERVVPLEEQLKSEAEEGNLRLGSLRIRPRVAIREAQYDTNVFASAENPKSDYSAVASAGLRLLLPVRHVYLVVDASPEYQWYASLVERRAFAGHGSALLAMFFNHVSFEVNGGADRVDRLIALDVPGRAVETTSLGSARLEVEIAGHLSAFATADYQKRRYRNTGDVADGNDLSVNDRDDAAARVGLRWRISRSVDVAAGVEQSWSDFVGIEPSRDNQSRALVGQLAIERPRWFFIIRGGYRTGRPWHGSDFLEYSTPTGSFTLSYQLQRPLEIRFNGDRRVSYGVSVTNPYFLQSVVGAELGLKIGPRVIVRAAGEYGRNDYSLAGSGTVTAGTDRIDRYTSVNGSISLALWQDASARFLVSQTNYDSSDPGQNRKILRLTAGISIDKEFFK